MSALAAGQGWSRNTPMRGEDGVGPVDAEVAVADRGGGERDVGDRGREQPAVSRCQDTHFMPTLGNSR